MKRKTLMKKIAVPMAVLMAMAVAPVQAFGTTEAEPEAITDEAKAVVEEVAEGVVGENLPGENTEANTEATEPEAVEEEVVTEEANGGAKLTANETGELKISASDAVTARENLTYAGEELQLVDFKSDRDPGKDHYKYEVKVGLNGDEHSHARNVTAKDAGTYIVYWTKYESNRYNSNTPWYWSKMSGGDVEVTIAPAGINIKGIEAKTRVYDGTKDAKVEKITKSANKYVKGAGSEWLLVTTDEDVNGEFDNKNVGNGKTVTVDSNNFKLIGTGSYYKSNPNNYTVESVEVKGEITAKEIDISGITGKKKTYDGTNKAELNYEEIILDAKCGTDELGLDIAGEFNDPNVGEREITITKAPELTGSDKDNYSLIGEINAEAQITKKEVTCTLANATKVEGEQDPPLSLKFNGVVEKDVPDFEKRFVAKRVEGNTPGDYQIKVFDKESGEFLKAQEVGVIDKNYDYTAFASATATFTITEAVVPVDDTDEDVDKDDDAKTGDIFSFFPVAFAALAALAGVCTVFFRRRRD